MTSSTPASRSVFVCGDTASGKSQQPVVARHLSTVAALVLGLSAWLVLLPAAPAAAQAEIEGVVVPVEVRFIGNVELDEGDLRDASPVALDRLAESGSAADMFDAAVDLETHYHDTGFSFATVVPQRDVLRAGGDPADPQTQPRLVRVTFRIDEGPRVEVVEIRFAGHSGVFDLNELQTYFARLRLGWFGTGPAWYSQRKIDDACREIEQQYRANGFLEAEVMAPTLEEGAVPLDRTRYRLIVRIDEGPQYFLRTISLAGRDVEEEHLIEVRRRLAERLYERTEESMWLEDAPPYTPGLQVALTAIVSSYFKDLGHFAVAVDERVRLDPVGGAAHLSFVVTPGPVYRVGRVEFHNLQQFSEGFLRSLIPLRDDANQRYSLALEQEAFQQLMRTGLIQQLNVTTTVRTENGQRYVDYRYDVNEARSIELTFLIGYGSYELLRGSVDLAERNAFGIGRTVGIRALASFRMREIVPRFTDPWTLGGEWPYTVSGFYRWRAEPGFTQEGFGAAVTLAHRISPQWRFALAYQIERSVVFDIQPGVDLEDVEPLVLLGMVQPRLTFDTRDSFFDPHDGFLFSVAIGLHSPWLGGDVSFAQFIVRLAGFLTVVEDGLVLALRYDLGANWNWRGERIPLQERFFNGGSETVRSFRQDRLLRPDETGPRSSGGLVRNVATVELRHKWFGPLWGALFVDAGNLVGGAGDWFTLATFRYAIGYGLRFLTPIGPLRLDFAWNPDRREDVEEDEFVVHFAVGYSF